MPRSTIYMLSTLGGALVVCTVACVIVGGYVHFSAVVDQVAAAIGGK